MKEKDFIKKINSMLPGCKKVIQKESLRLFKSGGIDTNSFENNYVLPKIILLVTLENLSKEFYFLGENNKKDLKNLRNF